MLLSQPANLCDNSSGGSVVKTLTREEIHQSGHAQSLKIRIKAGVEVIEEKHSSREESTKKIAFMGAIGKWIYLGVHVPNSKPCGRHKTARIALNSMVEFLCHLGSEWPRYFWSTLRVSFRQKLKVPPF